MVQPAPTIIPSSINALKDDVRELLRYGKEEARTGKELAGVLGLRNDRNIRRAIRELIADGVPIASTVAFPYGYYIANTIEEANEYMKDLRSRLVNDAYRRRDFKLAARNILEPGQLGLF